MTSSLEALSRLTEVTVASSRRDWEAIKKRLPMPRGVRQQNFTPTEVILCLATMLVVNHRRFGGSTSHLAPTPVPQLARLFCRPPSSILAKMANLDGSRSHSGRAELEAAAILLERGAVHLLSSYQNVLAAARSEGILVDHLPDFLKAEFSLTVLLGQDELNDGEVEEVVVSRVRNLAERTGLAEQVTERLLVAVARVGQHAFASGVHANCNNRCVFCGLSPGPDLARSGLLRASHIKPWRSCSDKERLDVTNGLSACPDHDAAFDVGLLYVDDDLSIRIGETLQARIQVDLRVRETFGQPPVADALLLARNAQRPASQYLRWHREHIAAA